MVSSFIACWVFFQITEVCIDKISSCVVHGAKEDAGLHNIGAHL